jgi:putative transposase
VVRFLPLIEEVSRKYRWPVDGSVRVEETYIKIKGVWKYFYRALDKPGDPVDLMLTAKREAAAARRFLNKPMTRNGRPTM